MQTFKSTPLLDEELDKLASKIPELQKVSFQCVNKELHEIDETYPFSMPNWLLIMITIWVTIFVVMLVCMIWYLKYGKVTGKVSHFLTSCNSKKQSSTATS